MSYPDLPDLISINTHIDPQIRVRAYDSNYTSRKNWFDLPGIPCWISEPKPLNGFDSIGDVLAADCDQEPLAAEFRGHSDVLSHWNIYWTEAAAFGGGLELDDPAFGSSWTTYLGAHTWFDGDPELPCESEGHNCLGTHSRERDAQAAAETAKRAPVPLIIIETLTPTPSEIDAYNWHW